MAPTASPASSPLKRAVLVLLVLAAVFAAYSPSLSGEFVWDDEALIPNARSIHSLQPLSSYFTRGFWSEDQDMTATNYFRPLVTLSYALDWQFWEGRPQGFHLTNVLVHLFNCLLTFLLARRWRAKLVPALVATAAFGLHPRLTECVAWISGRTDVFAAFFVLLALLAYPLPFPLPNGRQGSSGPGGGDGASLAKPLALASLSAAFALLGLFCKEVAVAGIAALFALELRGLARGWSGKALQAAAVRLAPLAISVGAYAALRSSNADLARHAPLRILGGGVVSVLAAIGEYLRMTVFFFQPEFQVGIRDLPSTPMAVLGGAAVLAAIVLFVRRGIRNALSSEGLPLLVLAAAALAPVCHVVVRDDVWFAADRFLYVPLCALAVGGAIAFPKAEGFLTKSRRRGVVAALAALTVLAASLGVTSRQAGRWADHVRLFGWACMIPERGKHIACDYLAEHLVRQGQPDTALALLRKTMVLNEHVDSEMFRNYVQDIVANNQNEALANLGRYGESLEFSRAMASKASKSFHVTRAVTMVALTLLEQGKCGEAREFAQREFPRFRYGQRRLDGFTKTLDAVCPLMDSLGDAYGRPPKDLTEREIDVSIRIGRALKDRFRLTGLYLEVLGRGTFGPNARSEAALYLEEKGVCPLLAEAFGPDAPLPPRCAPIPSEILETSAPPI